MAADSAGIEDGEGEARSSARRNEDILWRFKGEKPPWPDDSW
jgi:hypothetical protein